MMDYALEVVSVQATAPSTSAAFTAVTGNSLVVRDSKQAWLVGLWGKRQADGFFRLTSPLLHDAVVGIQQRIDAGQTRSTRLVFPQELTPQDNLVATGGGSAVAGDIELQSLLIMYDGLAGICGKLITHEQLMSNAVELYDSENTIAAGTTGGYSGSELLNAEQDQLKANENYAIVGATTTAQSDIATVRYTSPDWGNLGIGLPVSIDNRYMGDYFVEVAKEMNMPLIPVFNASQKSSVFIDVLADENGTDPTIITHMVRLKRSFTFGKRGR